MISTTTMFISSTSLLLSALPSLANAFPAHILNAVATDPIVSKRAEETAAAWKKRQAGAGAASALFEPVPIFNERLQFVNVSKGSGHEYVAPGPNDLRGPCPGLNAFANHNFLPHNGYATVLQYIQATTTVVGMGPNLALFLSAYGGAIDGDILDWSMGGRPSLPQGGVTGILGNGLIGSHNKYEGDASPTRPDLYDPSSGGNNYRTEATQFQEMIDASPGGYVTMESLTQFRSKRWDQQVSRNPYFFSGPFTGVLVQPAAYTFIYRFMANHSKEDTVGRLSYETVKSWFGIEGESGKYKAVQGGERIPENWYRRAIEYPYDTPYFLADLADAALLHPKFLSIGGNIGTTNSFSGVDVADLTGGLYNSGSLLQGNNLACFVYQLAAQAKPDAVLGALDTLTGAIGKLIGGLSCPQLKAIDSKVLQKFPGYTKQAVYG